MKVTNDREVGNLIEEIKKYLDIEINYDINDKMFPDKTFKLIYEKKIQNQ